MARLTLHKVPHLLDRPAATQPTVVRLGGLGLDAGPRLRLRLHPSLSFSSALASTPCAETKSRVPDIASNMVVLGTLQRAATDTIQEGSCVSEELADESVRHRHR